MTDWKLAARYGGLYIGCESNLPLRGDHPIRLEQVARGVQEHGNEVEVRCSGW
jgi:hypothetical protein